MYIVYSLMYVVYSQVLNFIAYNIIYDCTKDGWISLDKC